MKKISYILLTLTILSLLLTGCEDKKKNPSSSTSVSSTGAITWNDADPNINNEKQKEEEEKPESFKDDRSQREPSDLNNHKKNKPDEPVNENSDDVDAILKKLAAQIRNLSYEEKIRVCDDKFAELEDRGLVTDIYYDDSSSMYSFIYTKNGFEGAFTLKDFGKDKNGPDPNMNMQPQSSAKNNAVGTWYTEGYDEDNNWALSYKIELLPDKTAKCTGWRNKDTGYYDNIDDFNILITFDHCESDEAGEGYKLIDGYKYTIEMTINGDTAQIRVNSEDPVNNLEDGQLFRNISDRAASNPKTDVNINDGEYITDESYNGNISSNGSSMTITTAFSHYDDDWNTILDYEKDTYTLPVSDDCKCIIFTEDREEYPVTEQIDFINDFLQGNSGLPINITITNGEVTEIGFSS